MPSAFAAGASLFRGGEEEEVVQTVDAKMMALNPVFPIPVCSGCELIYMLREIFKVSALVHLLYSVSPSTVASKTLY